MEGAYYVDLTCRGLTFISPDCAAWVLDWESDGTLNVFEGSKGLFPMLTSREPHF